MLLATGAMAEILGVQPGTSDNPKDNVPKEIQRDGAIVSPGGSGLGTRSDELVGIKKGETRARHPTRAGTTCRRDSGGWSCYRCRGPQEEEHGEI